MGIVYGLTGQAEKALEAHERSRRIIEKLVAADPSAVHYQRTLASTLNNIGDVRLGLRATAKALESYTAARDLLEALVKAHPKAESYRMGLAFSLTGQGRARLKLGESRQGKADLRAANAIWERLTLSTNESSYALAGNHALIAAASASLGSGVSQAEAETEAKKAVECLKKPLAAGYRSIAVVRADADFRALGGRDDFESMLLDVAVPRDPFQSPGASSH
jgi:tetratricopeptide (TPR) repeat protein